MANAADAHIRETHLTDTGPKGDESEGSARRAIIACSAAALCMAAGGLWLVPSEDAAMQLIKLFSSVVMLLGGLILFNGLNRPDTTPEVQIDPVQRQLRVYEYDAKGCSKLNACYNIDDLKELSVEKRRLSARDGDGTLVLEVPLGSPEEEAAIRSMMSRAS